LDEIHQQSVFSSSQHTLSSFGSVPAPIEVVDALPVKLYRKLSKHLNEDDAQYVFISFLAKFVVTNI